MNRDDLNRHREQWGHLDETVADPGAVPLSPQDVDAQRWLMEQRVVHGLLRALHTADADAREARIEAILTSVSKAPNRARLWSRLLWAAAVLGLLAVGYRLLPGTDALPRAEALVARAVEQLARPVDRRFAMRTYVTERSGRERVLHDMTLTTRPGNYFRLHGEMILWSFDAGCDGETLWFQPHSPWMQRSSVPLDRASRLTDRMGDILDLGYLDVHALVRRLPESLELRSVGREASTSGGPPLIRVEAVNVPDRLEAIMRHAYLLFETDSGMVSHVEVELVEPRRRPRKVVFDYLGTVDLGETGYQRPW